MQNSFGPKLGLFVGISFLLSGCGTPRLASDNAPDFVRSYEAPLDATWRAALSAAGQEGLQVTRANAGARKIVLRRGPGVETVGEHADLIFRAVEPDRTIVEVSCHQMGFELYTLREHADALLQQMASELGLIPAAGGTAPATRVMTDSERGPKPSPAASRSRSMQASVVPQPKETPPPATPITAQPPTADVNASLEDVIAKERRRQDDRVRQELRRKEAERQAEESYVKSLK